jgi:hypothetical protein
MHFNLNQPPPAPIDQARRPLHLRTPFLNQETGLGDAVKHLTDALGVPSCEPCKKRQEILNRVRFTPWET